MIVADIMTSFPEALGPDDTIHKAAKMMRDHDYGVIPILDENDSLVGIVTDRDIVVKAIAHGHGPETPLSECMTANPDTVPKDLPIAQALHLMDNRQIRRLPVVEIWPPHRHGVIERHREKRRAGSREAQDPGKRFRRRLRPPPRRRPA